jgi:anti-anti-sigma factor
MHTLGVSPESSDHRAPRRALSYRVRFDAADVALIALDGDLDRASATDLSDALAACAAVGIRHVELDAEQVTFADSHGVHTLQRHAAAFAHRAGWLRIVRPSRALRRVLELAG